MSRARIGDLVLFLVIGALAAGIVFGVSHLAMKAKKCEPIHIDKSIYYGENSPPLKS